MSFRSLPSFLRSLLSSLRSLLSFLRSLLSSLSSLPSFPRRRESSQNSAKHTLSSCLYAALFGIMLPLSMAPYHLTILAFVSVFGWLFLLGHQPLTFKRAACLGLAYGVGVYGFGLRWLYHSVHLYGGLAPWLAVLIVVFMVWAMAVVFLMPMPWIFLGVCRVKGAPSSVDIRTMHPMVIVVLWPSIWVLFEFLKTYLFTGFPWLLLGESQLGWPLSGMAPILGVYGVSWVTVCVAASLYALCMGRHPAKGYAMIPALLLCLLSAYWGQITWTHPVGKPITVNVIQPNVPLADKWNPDRIPGILDHYDQAIRTAPSAELYVLPEGALPSVRYAPIHAWLEGHQGHFKAQGHQLIIGAMLDDGPYNGLLMLGKHQGVYTKQHLVPFGEYIPFERWLAPVFEWLRAPMSRLKSHPNAQQSLSTDFGQITPLICYETAYPVALASRVADASSSEVCFAHSKLDSRLRGNDGRECGNDVREHGNDGSSCKGLPALLRHPRVAKPARGSSQKHAPTAHPTQGNFLLAVSEDAWFGPSDEPGQHLQGAQMRALETGRPLVFATNQGISALVQANGRIQQQSAWGKNSVLHGAVQPRAGQTPWVQWGRHGVFWLNAAMLLGPILLYRWCLLGKQNAH